MGITVPRYDESQIDPARRPTPRAQGLGAEAFGAGLAHGLAVSGRVMADEARRQVVRANTAKVYESRNAMNAQELDRLYGDSSKPGFGVLKKRGLAAAQDEQAVLGGFKQWGDEYEKTLANDDQKMAFRAMMNDRLASMQENLIKHSRKEMDWHQGEVLKATQQSSLDRIGTFYGDPKEVEKEIEVMKLAGSNRLDQEGVGTDPESATIRANYLKGIESKARGLVVEKYLESDDFPAAKKYLEDHRDTFHADDLAKLEHAVGQEEIAFQKQQEKIQKQKADDAETAVLHAIAQVELNGGIARLRDIPKDQFNVLMQLNPKRADDILDELRREREHQENLAEAKADRAERRADRRERQAERETSAQNMNWSNLVLDPASLKAANLDKMYLKGAISKQHYADLTRKKSELLNNPEREKHIRTRSAAMEDILGAAGIKQKTENHVKAVEYIESRLSGIDNPSYEDVQRVTREAVYKVPRDWAKDKPAYQMTIDDVPGKERKAIVQAFKQKGMVATDQDILDLFIRKQSKGQ